MFAGCHTQQRGKDTAQPADCPATAGCELEQQAGYTVEESRGMATSHEEDGMGNDQQPLGSFNASSDGERGTISDEELLKLRDYLTHTIRKDKASYILFIFNITFFKYSLSYSIFC